jgi:hypothetical protein
MVLAGDAQAAVRLLGRDMTPEQADSAVQAYQALVP